MELQNHNHSNWSMESSFILLLEQYQGLGINLGNFPSCFSFYIASRYMKLQDLGLTPRGFRVV